MKLLDVVILVLAVFFLMVGVHQGLQHGWGQVYFIFMFSLGLLFLYSYRRQKRNAQEEEDQKSKGKSPKKGRRN